jgi:phosphopantothenoylcysteine decarboxylase/phosphopantothenate--cysteine ligase
MHFLITAGGTREYIDPVRFISNASSGKMGYALARAALRAGHKVTLITTPVTQRPPKAAKIINVETAAQMSTALKNNFPKCDCLIMAAAVSDYTPIRPAKNKLKRTDKSLTINLKPTVDILAWAGKHKNERRATSDKRRIVVGFALEDKDLRKNAEKKLKQKNLDMIIANKPAAIAAEKSTVHIKNPNSPWLKITNANKTTIAKRVIALILDIPSATDNLEA